MQLNGVQLKPEVFGREHNEALVHQVVTAYLAGSRSGTKAQKSRSDASGGGAKPWRQKGTGRARAGTIRSPIWVGGGKTFAATNRDFSQKVNKKMYRGAMRSILSELVRQARLIVTQDIIPAKPKTKELAAKLKEFGVKSALIIVDGFESNLYLAARNIPNIDVVEVSQVNPVSLIKFEKVFATEGAIRKLEEVLA